MLLVLSMESAIIMTAEKKTDYTNPVKWKGRVLSAVFLLILLLLVIFFAVSMGSSSIPFSTTISILLSQIPFLSIPENWGGTTETVITGLRMPRVLLAGLTGAALAVAGATYQGLFRNPLADPYLIGVSQGAGLGAVIGFLIPISSSFWSLNLVSIFCFHRRIGGGIRSIFTGKGWEKPADDNFDSCRCRSGSILVCNYFLSFNNQR